MGYVSIAFSIAAILIVALLFYITSVAYKTSNVSWLETFKNVWSSSDNVNKVLSQSDSNYDDIGSFEGYDVPDDKRTWVYISDLSKKQNLIDFLNEGSPDRIGTKTIKSRENEMLDSTMT